MSTTKRINGDYKVIADNMTITGNLTVSGTQTTVNSVDTAINDRVIILNDGESSAGISGGTSGIEVDRGTSTNAQLVYDETADAWKVDQGSGSLVPIVQSVTGLTEVVDDTSPQLGGSLDVNSQSIVSTSDGNITLAPNGTGVTVINSAITLSEESDPTGAANVTKVYAKEASSGGTGLFTVTDTVGPEELVSKTKAIVFGIIF